MSLTCLGDHAIGHFEDRLRAAVVLFQGHDSRVGVFLGKVENVSDRGSTERVNRLGVIADGGQSRSARAQSLEQPALEPVGVLIFIHQHKLEPPLVQLPHLRVLPHQPQP